MVMMSAIRKIRRFGPVSAVGAASVVLLADAIAAIVRNAAIALKMAIGVADMVVEVMVVTTAVDMDPIGPNF
jgi:hypothetical protein